ncbi:MAG: branched-chain amino acid ABC transporter permease [Alphaproteobacteria bacterium]
MIRPQETRGLVIFAIGLVIAAALPYWGQDYWLEIGISVAMYTAIVTSWTIFSGPTHYISLSTAAFYGVGAYTVAIGQDFLAYPYLLPIAVVLGAALALLVGLTTLRLSGVYFVIFTLGLAELIRQVVTWSQNWTGQKGVLVDAYLESHVMFWQFVALATAVFLIGWLIQRSKVGFALRVIGNDEQVAIHSGIHSSQLKVLLFMVPGGVAALAGAMQAPQAGYIEPLTAFNPQLSFIVVIMALLGGTGRIWGGLLGVMVLEAIRIFLPTHTTLVLGLFFLLIVYFIPHGLVGVILDLRHRWQAGRG